MKPKASPLRFLAIAGTSLLAFSCAQAATRTWGGGNLDWTNTTASGWNAAVPGGSDTATINSGTVTVTTSITVANTPTPIAVNGGTLVVSTGKLVGGAWNNAKTVTIGSGATLRLNNWGYDVAGSLGGLDYGRGRLVVNGGIIEVTGDSSQSGRNFTVGTGGTTLRSSVNSGQTWTLNRDTNPLYHDIQVNSGLTLTLDGTGDGVIENYIVNTSGSGNVTKSGAGTWTLTGANTYTGNTSVNQGTLIATTAGALPGYNSSGKVTINGGTLGVRVGGAGWSTANADTLLTNATKTSGALGIDTTNGNLTQWTAFTTTNLGGALGLTKLGTNTLTLDQANTYAGATTVAAGTLALGASGSIANSPSITVAAGATLDVSLVSGGWSLGTSQTLNGTGTVTGTVTLDGNLSPGNSPGVMAFSSSLALGANSTTTLEIDGATRGTGYDGVDVGSTLTLDGDLVLDLGTTLAVNSTFDLFAVTGSTSGDFDTVSLQGDMGTGSFTFSSGVWSFVDGSNTWTFTESTGDLSFSTIPEPGAALLGGLGVLLLFRRRR